MRDRRWSVFRLLLSKSVLRLLNSWYLLRLLLARLDVWTELGRPCGIHQKQEDMVMLLLFDQGKGINYAACYLFKAKESFMQSLHGNVTHWQGDSFPLLYCIAISLREEVDDVMLCMPRLENLVLLLLGMN
ncbi:hypothetical protein RHMOL_Rhmol13G0296300 [Rhododendron molle]|uniref:Uncharacterized protein n=1 Tax=Rhododendron molle TaxID=49168 RepID=A0ACC0LCL9_RHOML|nr:hypothetical protein RHMOL_Rhmol13G0296300 [Rhododendron molle]